MLQKKYYFLYVLLFCSAFLAMYCYLQTLKKPSSDTEIAKTISVWMKKLRSEDMKIQQKAAQKIFSLRHNMQDFIPQLIENLLIVNDDYTKVCIINALAHFEVKTPVLHPFLDDACADVRTATIGMLKTDPEVSARILRKIEEDEDCYVRKAALEYLFAQSIDMDKKTGVLIDVLKNDDSDTVRMTAASFLGKVEITKNSLKEKIDEALINNITNESGETRYHSIISLGNSDSLSVALFISSYLKFSDMRPYCVEALKNMCGRNVFIKKELLKQQHLKKYISD